MKAIQFESFGTSEVLKINTVARPEPTAQEVLIKNEYTSVNPVDWKIREGHLQGLLPHQLPIIPGWDVAGEIVAVGSDVNHLNVGDRVYAYARKETVKHGTYAEYVALDANKVALAPTNITYAEAAAVPLVGLTAWQGLFDFLNLKAGEKILITAGSGGVGSFSIQFAKHVGAHVITTASKKNHEYLRSIGADEVIDYTKEDIVDVIKKNHPEGIDAVFDGAGGEAIEQGYAVLKNTGRLVSIVDSPDQEKARPKNLNVGFHFVEGNADQLTQIAKLIEQKKVTIPTISERNIKEAALAQDENQERHVQGKIVLKIDFH